MDASDAIKAYRAETEATQQALADVLGVRQSTVASWESGHRSVSASLVGRVSACTGIPMHVLRPDLFPQPAAA